jgi:phenylalanyl-tRNA synthetase beta chain
MRLSYQWLNDYVDIRDITPEELADALTRVGLEIEGIERRNQGVSGVVVGEVLHVEQHPNADRLRVCQVNVGEVEPYTIVCGAPNVAPGQRVPVALPGAILPGGKIGKAKLRGVESNGMLCSAGEIGLEVKLLPKEQTEGLYILPNDAPIREDIVKYLHLDDVVLEIGLTPNRSDCLSMRGIAYEVGAIFDRKVNFPETIGCQVSEGGPVQVRIETDLCAEYQAQVMTATPNGTSPIWMQMRLLAMGVRPINPIVDVTNYVMLEWGQPLHAFDFGEIHGETIVVRQARPGETMTTLDGEERELTEETIVISDVDRAIGIAGVMGGLNSEVTSATKQIVLESAAFDAKSVRKTGQRLGLRSEAQQRFEKGIDPVAIEGALLRAVELLQEVAGAETIGGVVRARNSAVHSEGVRVPFSPQNANQLLGTDIPAEDMLDIFRRLGFTVSGGLDDTEWTVYVPTRRPDVRIPADLAEEIGRLYGLDAIPSTLPYGPTTVGVRTPEQRLRKRTREVLIAAGMNEVVTYSFTHPSKLDPLRLDKGSAYYQMIPLMHPLSEERSVLRTHMLPGLIEVAEYNLARGVSGGQIFEIGRVYWPSALPLTEQPCERTLWAGLWFGEQEAYLGERPRKYDFFDAKGTVETWLQAMGWQDGVQFQPAKFTWLHPGRSAEVTLDGERIGIIGELHPETLARFDLGAIPVIYAEFDLDVLSHHISESWRVRHLPKFPASRRDLAVILKNSVTAKELLDAAREALDEDANVLESCFVFDVYQGKGIPEGHKSVAVGFVYRAENRTLTDEEIATLEKRIIDAWTAKFGATLRS